MKGSRFMNWVKIITPILACGLFISAFSACSPVDKNYGVSSEVSTKEDTKKTISDTDDHEHVIMSSDRVMSKFFDISLFDEENYANVYLGKKFEISANYAGYELSVPTKISDMKEIGWNLADGNDYNENSLVFAYETIDAVLVDKNGVKVSVQFYNSTTSSVKLSECYIVKFIINNGFYKNPKKYNKFDVNGINNKMAITDIINILGTPSHFYRVSEKSYYLDYFITEEDRRNGITVYINPQDDSITSIEFSYYK